MGRFLQARMGPGWPLLTSAAFQKSFGIWQSRCGLSARLAGPFAWVLRLRSSLAKNGECWNIRAPAAPLHHHKSWPGVRAPHKRTGPNGPETADRGDPGGSGRKQWMGIDRPRNCSTRQRSCLVGSSPPSSRLLAATAAGLADHIEWRLARLKVSANLGLGGRLTTRRFCGNLANGAIRAPISGKLRRNFWLAVERGLWNRANLRGLSRASSFASTPS